MEATAAIDRRLMEMTGREAPRVVLLPQAAAAKQRAKTVALARNHWSRLGASFTMAYPDQSEAAAIDSVLAADIIVLPGGHPNKLIAGLASSLVTDLLIARWLSGAAVSGSSAGAMAMFEWRINLYPPDPLRPIPGLGLVDGYVAAPHFDRFRASHWAHKALPRLGGLDILGLDEATGLVGFNRDMEVVGRGAVTVVNSHGHAVYRSGEWVPLDLLGRSALRTGVWPGVLSSQPEAASASS